MKTSLDLPDELYRHIKSKSALEGRAVRDVAIELFSAWVNAGQPTVVRETAAPPLQADATDASRLWMAEWQRLGREIEDASDGSVGLVDELMRSRR